MSEWPYNTAQWQHLRRLKLQENTLCETCLQVGRLEPAIAVDHVISISDGGDPFPPFNGLKSLCVSCHNRKTRVVDQLDGKLGIKGCDEHGVPLDQAHPWNVDRYG
jgi:5-methylcytosine-specific restriction endonuclease McrA